MELKFRQRIPEFLALQKVAVAGYSTQPGQPANYIHDKLRRLGYSVWAVNPRAGDYGEVEVYPSLEALPDTPDFVMACTPPEATAQLVEDCARLGIPRIWMHRSLGQGSWSEAGQQRAEALGLICIPASCPMMHLEPDFGHRCMRWLLNL